MTSEKGQIVVGVDLNDSSESGKLRSLALVNLAHALGSWVKLPVHLIFASDSHKEPTDIRKDQSPYVDEFRKIAKDKKMTFSLKSGTPVSELMSLEGSLPGPIEFYVLGTRNSGIAKSLFFGSVTDEIAKKSEKPIVLLGPDGIRSWENKSDFSNVRRILVATDMSERATAVENFAISFAKRTGASITLLHNAWLTYKATEDAAIQAGAVPLIFEEFVQTIEQQSHQALLERKKAFETQGVDCEVILDTKPHTFVESVLAVQENEYCLLIMGLKNRNRLITAVWGSTLRDTLAQSHLPIIAVKC